MTNTTNINTAATIRQIASTHVELSHHYGCRAFMVTVTFLYAGIVHRARKFFRADMPSTGRIELYTIEPYQAAYTTCTEIGWYTHGSEDPMGYVADVPTSRRDRLAHALIERATGGDVAGNDQSERYAAIELA